MQSSFTWLDYSEHERQKSLDIINLFKSQDTRDELGLGTIRDAFADMLFPGTGTVQTRARYFFFVPWIYTRLERRQTQSNEIGPKARKAEVNLIYALEESGESDGIIGIDAREKLQRLPSNIYWLGLSEWGIRKFPGSQAEYHRSLNRWYASQKNPLNDDKEPQGGRVHPNWHPDLPSAPKDFPDSASFVLVKEEATFLRDQILTNAPKSLLAWLVDRGKSFDFTEFPWMHPQYSQFSDHNKGQLEHARNFSEVMLGAALLYNLMLAEITQNRGRRDEYREKMTEWAQEVESRRRSVARWSRDDFWSVAGGVARIHPHTRDFVNGWLGLVIDQGVADKIAKSDHARGLIRARESQLKKGLARLENQSARELWNGAAGTTQLNYRWPVTQQIVNDILEGLSGGKRNA